MWAKTNNKRVCSFRIDENAFELRRHILHDFLPFWSYLWPIIWNHSIDCRSYWPKCVYSLSVASIESLSHSCIYLLDVSVSYSLLWISFHHQIVACTYVRISNECVYSYLRLSTILWQQLCHWWILRSVLKCTSSPLKCSNYCEPFYFIRSISTENEHSQ
jgi:hypothetical protein